MRSTTPTRVARVAAPALLAAVGALALLTAPARARIVLLSTSSGAPGPQDVSRVKKMGEIGSI